MAESYEINLEIQGGEQPEIVMETEGGATDGASARNAEAWAVGKRNGADVPSTDPTYHNNAKYYATDAAASAADAAASAAEAEQYTPEAIHTWLEENIDPDSGYALDRTLSEKLAAAPADMVGDLKSDLSQADETIFNGYKNNPPVANGSFSASGVYTTNNKRLRTNFIPVKTGDRIVIDNGSLKHACGAWEGTLSTATNIRNDSTFNTNDEEITSPVNGYYIVVFAKQDSTQEIALSDFDGSVLVYANGMYRNAKAIDDANAKFNDFLYGASYSFTGKVSSTNKFDMPLLEGIKYTALNNTGAAISLNLYKANGTSKVVSSSLSNGSSIDFTVDAEDYTQIGGWFNAGSTGTLSVTCDFSAIEELGSIPDLEDNISNLTKLQNVQRTDYVKKAGYFFNTNNQDYAANQWDYYTIPVNEGEQYTIDTKAGQSARAWIFRNSSQEIISMDSYSDTPVQATYNVTVPENAVEMIMNSQPSGTFSIIQKNAETVNEDKIIYKNKPLPDYLDDIDGKTGNILAGKILCCCGDSITYGADMDSPGIVTPTIESYQYSAYTKQWTRWTASEPAAYGYQIAARNGMIFYNGGVSGACVQGSGGTSTVPGFSVEDGEYTLLPDNIDYLTLFFGWNDTAFGSLGTINDTTNDSYYGGYNVVLHYLINKYPYTKIALIVPFGTDVGHRQAIRDLANKWGLACFDMMQGGTPLYYNKEPDISVDSSIITANRAKFQANGAHPNYQGHYLISTMLEAFLRGI